MNERLGIAGSGAIACGLAAAAAEHGEVVLWARSPQSQDRAKASVEKTFGKAPVEVPDLPGFVVNRLLFPYLFSAVFFQEETGLDSESIDTCMKLGAGHPMGPLALLDFVGLDVSKAIGEAIGTRIPDTVNRLIDEGALGKKSGRGFYTY